MTAVPSASPRIDVSSSSVSNTRSGAEARLEPPGDAVDAALDADVLAEDERLGMALEHAGESRVDRLRERQRSPAAGPPTPASAATAAGERGASGRTTSCATAELRPLYRGERALADARAGVEVVLGELLPAANAEDTSQRPSRATGRARGRP